jgi:biopolymer transport protein ExbD
MAFGSFGSEGGMRTNAEINMVPLIDVMLVLLVIFIVTTPLLTHAVKIDLPTASSTPNQTKPDHVELSIDSTGTLFWNGEKTSEAELPQRLAQIAAKKPQPELHLRADKTTQYQTLSEEMADAAKAGVTRIGFVSDPSAEKK